MLKRFGFLLSLLLLLVAGAQAQFSSTTNMGMKKPNSGLTSGWDVYLNGNFDQLDSYLSGINTLTQNSATPSVSGAKYWQTNSTSPTTITNFTNGISGQELLILGNDSNTTISANATIAVRETFTSTTVDWIRLILIGTVWTEVGRSADSLDFPDSKTIPFAICVNGSPGTAVSTTTAVGGTCRAGTNNKDAYLGPFTTSDTVVFKVHLTKDWDTLTAPSLSVDVATTDTTNAHTIILQAQTECAKLDGSTTDDVAFNAAQSLSTVSINTTANQTWTATLAALTTTGCSAPGIMWVKITRTTDTATNVELYEGNITIPRHLKMQAN